MPDTFTDTLTTIPLGLGVPFLLVFWYADSVRHPARPRWRAFLMALAVLAVVQAATLAWLYYVITVREGSPFLLIPVALAFPFALRALIRGWLGSPPAVRRVVPELSGPSPSGPDSTGPGVSPGGPERCQFPPDSLITHVGSAVF